MQRLSVVVLHVIASTGNLNNVAADNHGVSNSHGKRDTMSTTPAEEDQFDLWSWRAANVRLCDCFLMPLCSGSPRILLYALRHSALHVEYHAAELQAVTALLQEVPAKAFCLKWTVAPHLLFLELLQNQPPQTVNPTNAMIYVIAF